MILLFVIIEIIILIALAAIIIAAIAVLIIRLNKGGGGGGNSPAAIGLKALRDLEAKVKEVIENGSATATDCTEMRNLLSSARSNGVPSITISNLKTQIDKLCP